MYQAEAVESPQHLPPSTPMDDVHFKECLIELLQDMFGEESVAKVNTMGVNQSEPILTFSQVMTGDSITITVDNKNAMVNLVSMKAECSEDPTFEKIVQTAVSKLHQSLVPIRTMNQDHVECCDIMHYLRAYKIYKYLLKWSANDIVMTDVIATIFLPYFL